MVTKYKFRWSLDYFIRDLAQLKTDYTHLYKAVGLIFILLIICNLGNTASFVLAATVPLVIALAIILYLSSRSGNGAIRYTTIEPGRITIVRIGGKTVLEGISSIVHVTKEELDEDTSYDPKHDLKSETKPTQYGLSMEADKFSSTKYGAFTRICVNFKELAMVTCADGKKYLINYPKELLKQTSNIHVYKPKLKLKWKVGRVLAVISITTAFIGLIALLLEGMLIEFLILLLVTVFLLYPFGLSMIIETVRHIRIGTERITILLSSHQKTIVLDNIESIRYVTKKELEPSTTYAKQFWWFQRPRTCRGLSMQGKVFSNYKYGKFTRACNNFDELAMVTLANGKKYLINYPKELLETGKG